MFDCFYKYYNDQSLENAQELLDFISVSEDVGQIFDVDLFNYEVEIKNPRNIGYLLSSGTLGDRQRYPIYHRSFWVYNIERLNKNPESHILVQAEDNFDFRFGHYVSNKCFVHINSGIYNYSSSFSPEYVDWIIDRYKSIQSHFIIYAFPCVFLRYLEQFRSKLTNFHVLSSGYDAFFKSHGVYVNDCVIDWQTGLNFYTCKHNKRHFLPIFSIRDGYIRNLINICSRPIPISDLFTITGSAENCPCGKKYIPFTYIPHIKAAITKNDQYYYDLSLINYLESDYYSIQFIQNNDEILILYRGKYMTENDKSFLTDWWGSKGFNVVILKDRYLITGENGKLGAFFNNSLLQKPIFKIDIKYL
jgi:hypothetical protein